MHSQGLLALVAHFVPTILVLPQTSVLLIPVLPSILKPVVTP